VCLWWLEEEEEEEANNESYLEIITLRLLH